MAPNGDATLPATRRIRRSIGGLVARSQGEKDNATVDLGTTLAESRKKSRSKSIGPGGLDALKQGSGNRRASLAVPTKAPRSILKPTISPLPEIPPLKRPNTARISGPGSKTEAPTTGSSTDNLGGSKIAIKTEEEQQAAARQREERERRDARRKSLANRRVSFAAEATLHTFHEIEIPQPPAQPAESNRRSSSGGRRSSVVGREATPYAHNPPAEDDSPHQSSRRQSSGVQATPTPQHQQQDDTIASNVYSSDSDEAEAMEEISEVVEDDGNSSSDSDDGTMMSMDDATGTSIGSDRYNIDDGLDDDGETSTLDEILRQAALRAENQAGMEEGDAGGNSESDDGEEIIPSFGWIKKNQQPANSAVNPTAPANSAPPESSPIRDDATEMDMSMDMTRDIGQIISAPGHSAESEDDDEDGGDMTMDVTQAVGGILSKASNNANDDDDSDEDNGDMTMDVTQAVGGILSKLAAESAAPPLEDDDDDDDGEGDDATMELTTAIGGIHRNSDTDFYGSDGNEDMSMELTTAIGNVLGHNKRRSVAKSPAKSSSREAVTAGDVDADDTGIMDMTLGIGHILPTASQENEEPTYNDIGKEMAAVTAKSPRSLGKEIMTEEANAPSGPTQAIAAALSRRTSPRRRSTRTSEPPADEVIPGTSSFQSKVLRRSSAASAAPKVDVTPPTQTQSPTRLETPRQRSKSPKKATPQSARRTPLGSPKRNSVTKSSAKGSNSGSSLQKSLVFRNDLQGNRTPTVVLTPRKLSGVGADRDGLGSPKVAELFDRRSSIGEAAQEFVPGKRAVSFQDPQRLGEEVDRERQLERDREDGRSILEREADSADGKDAASSLREMIDSLSPKRKPLMGRKSLAVGGGWGLLGKRPIELDSDEEEEDNDGVKRLKGLPPSPVKSVRLQQPPSKAETAGRPMRSSQRQLDPVQNTTPSLSSPVKGGATTPKHQLRFKDVDDDPTATQDINFNRSPIKDLAQLERQAEEGQIHLQDFLNMTSIRFMELTTTKRRPTMAPGILQDGTMGDDENDMSLERCVVAGACTVPNLELYQHSCRELKKYISEGRRIVREIETDTFEENPPLFREYLSATPEVKALMDNQFKNVKTHARLLSKNMWYEWRMKLQDGLKEGLVRIAEGMVEDDEALAEQEALLTSTVPALEARYETLQHESENLEEVARELADCDPAELQLTREELVALDNENQRKKQLIEKLRQELEETEETVQSLTQTKEQWLADVQESEKIREDCRGWTSTEVNALKARVDELEKAHGWAVTGTTGTTLSMAFKREIELVFDIASFQPNAPSTLIDLWYIADGRQDKAVPKTADKEFFLQCTRDRVRALPQSRTPVHAMLRIVREAWEMAALVSRQVTRLNLTFPTKVARVSDSCIRVTSSLLLAPLETRVEISLTLRGPPQEGMDEGLEGIEVGIVTEAKVLYGESFNVSKIKEFVAGRVGGVVGGREEDWGDVLVELHGKLLARGKK